MDLNRKIAFKMPAEEFEEITIDRNSTEPDLVDMDSFGEKIELAVISKAFTCSNLESLNMKPNLHYWTPYIGKKHKEMFQHIKYRTPKSKDVYWKKHWNDCREMTEERLLGMQGINS